MKLESMSAAGALVLACMAGVTSAQAQTLAVIHNFTGGSDGANPVNGFAMDAKGTMYGTASAGGASGDGVVLEVTSKGKETVLHTFTGGADGATPYGNLLLADGGALYGTTMSGGASGQGTVYRLDGKKETILYSFAGGTDGAAPEAGLVMDASGNLYGTTSAGGPAGNGGVFMLAPSKKKNGAWKETMLYSFGTGTDGATPVGGVYLDASGNLYGTTSLGGTTGYGTVFELKPAKSGPWTESILYTFQNGSDGGTPYTGLVADSSGDLYGAATQGGVNGGGTVFELAKGNRAFSTIYSVPGWGISGTFRDIMIDASGNIFATTHCDGNNDAGTIYELSPSGGGWNYTLLYTFTGGSDGLYSISNLVESHGKLYGTTQYGGANSQGVIYQLTP
jgi:uncharacterized repeat protein (TIGR03803 family)